MEYQVLARRYRPQTFDEVVGQDHVVRTLKNAITQARVAHAYLFTGPRGVGKTSTARILAKSLNCERGPTVTPCGTCGFCTDIAAGRSLDVVEIDGASNRGIDEIRDLRENARYVASPGKKRIYIIDEVHMLTNEAWNALLKILEEPPPHVLFAFATTQPSKVLATILSRCQRFDFRRIPTEAIVGRLREIGAKEGFRVADEVYYLVARRADGGLRDAESLLDQVISFAGQEAALADAEEVLGVVGRDLHFDLTRAFIDKDPAGTAASLCEAVDRGADLTEIATGLLDHLRALFIASIAESPDEILDASPETIARLREQAALVSGADLLRLARILASAEREMRRSAHPRVILELALFEMATLDASVDLTELLDRLDAAGASDVPRGAPRGEQAATPPQPRRASARSGAAGGGAVATPPAAPRKNPPPVASGGAPQAGAREDRAPIASAAPPQHSPPRATAIDVDGAPSGQREAAPPSAAAPASALTLQIVRERWGELLAAVAGAKRGLSAFLEHGSPVELAGSTLVIGFAEADAFHRSEIDRAEHCAMIERGFAVCFGERVAVKTRAIASRAAADEAAARPGADSSRALLDHPGVRRALDFFEADIVSRRNGETAAGAPRAASPPPTPRGRRDAQTPLPPPQSSPDLFEGE